MKKSSLLLEDSLHSRETLSWFKQIHFSKCYLAKCAHTAQKMKFSIEDFVIKCDQLRIWSHILKKSLMENFFVQCQIFPTRGNFRDYSFQNKVNT